MGISISSRKRVKVPEKDLGSEKKDNKHSGNTGEPLPSTSRSPNRSDDSGSSTGGENASGRDGSIPVQNLIIKWSGKEYEIEDINRLKTVRDLKVVIQAKTGVQADRQKILNLTFKGKLAQDDCALTNLSLKPGQKLMMMGSLERDIQNVDIPPEDRPDVNNELDISEDDDDAVDNREVCLNKIARRVKEYRINVINPPRPDKKLLVLDIDYTLFDYRTTAETPEELMRPYLHEFLTSAYNDYDIAIWSATSMKWIEEKMRLLGVASNPAYKIVFYLDYLAMISVLTKKYGEIQVKPLGVIWGQFSQYSAKNSIMIDDHRRNFLMNPQSGLRIRPYRSANVNRTTDFELLFLAIYLRKIGKIDDFSNLNHREWKSYGDQSHGHSSK